ncbi:MAG: VIT family protein [Gemmatimonadetes bacterium]|nr:VIT family protein [Gemmatimonadota bacterium]
MTTTTAHRTPIVRGRHVERHFAERIGWLRAAVLGANDGIVSTAALIVGVAAAGTDRQALLLAGVAGLVAGAMSMAAGEYVSVSSQADTERADRLREQRELAASPEDELRELREIYQARGLSAELAEQVAQALTAHDALGAHLRDELGLTDELAARPVQAALASAATFAVGAALPLALAATTPSAYAVPVITVASLLLLAALGALAASAGGAGRVRGALRVTVWSALALALTAGVGRMVGTVG